VVVVVVVVVEGTKTVEEDIEGIAIVGTLEAVRGIHIGVGGKLADPTMGVGGQGSRCSRL
jgi:hypothetical protein